MFAKFFGVSTLSNGQWSYFTDNFLLATDRVVSFEYTKRFTKVGSFTMVLPFDTGMLRQMSLNGWIFYDGNWLWIQGISYDGKMITLTGTDAKGVLGTRISLFQFNESEPGTQGYDAVSGTTKECIRHYVEVNALLGTCQAGRELPIVAFSGADGLQNDSYMARLEYLSDIISTLCEDAGIGYEVTADVSSVGFRLETVCGTDRSFSQNERPRVIFSPTRRNVRSLTCEHGVENLYNVVYGVDNSEYVAAVYRDNPGDDIQLARRECTTSISEVTTYDPMFDKYALHQVEDNLASHSYSIEAAVSSGYGTAYELGDIVSVQDIYTGNMASYRITEATKSYSNGHQSLSLVFGTPKQKPLQKIVNSFLNGTARRR